MKFCAVGYVESDIYDDFFESRKKIEKKLNLLFDSHDYINQIENFDVCFNILNGEIKNKASYKPKKKELDLLIIIDYYIFKSSNSISQEKLLIDSILKMIKLLEFNPKTKLLNFYELIKDLENNYNYE